MPEKKNLKLTSPDVASVVGQSFLIGGNEVDIGIRCIRFDEPGALDGRITEKTTTVELDLKTGRERTKTISGKCYGRRCIFGNPVDRITQLLIHHSGADRVDPSLMFDVLYRQRGLSVHFAIEDDGRLWQFNDLADACWHAGKQHNNISVGVECCLFPDAENRPRYYNQFNRAKTGNLEHRIVSDQIHGRQMQVFAFTAPQCDTLARLWAGVWIAIGVLREGGATGLFGAPPLFYRDMRGQIPRTVIKKSEAHIGLIGHLQCTLNKIDPAGFPWVEFEHTVAKYYWDFSQNLGRNNK